MFILKVLSFPLDNKILNLIFSFWGKQAGWSLREYFPGRKVRAP